MTILISKLFFISIPTFYIALIVYLRLVLDRGIRPLFVPMSWLQIVLVVIILAILWLRLYILAKKEGFIEKKKSENFWMKEIVKRFKINHIVRSYIRFIDRIKINSFRVLAGSLTFNLALLAFVIKLEKIMTFKKFVFLIFALEMLSKLMVLVIFFLDILLFGKFYYFYKALALLLLPLFLSILKTLIIRFYADNFDTMLDYLTSRPTKLPWLEDSHVFTFKIYKRIPHFIKSIPDFVNNHFIPLFDILYLDIHCQNVAYTYRFNLINIFITLSYITGWTAILIFSLLAT